MLHGEGLWNPYLVAKSIDAFASSRDEFRRLHPGVRARLPLKRMRSQRTSEAYSQGASPKSMASNPFQNSGRF